MPYIQGALLLGDQYDEHIIVLECLLCHGATIRDGHPGGEPSRGREDVGEGTEEPVWEAAIAKQPVGKAPIAE